MPRKKAPAEKIIKLVPGEITHIVVDFSGWAEKISPGPWTRGPVIPVHGEIVPTKNGKRRAKSRKKRG
jgi:hypothetical protein